MLVPLFVIPLFAVLGQQILGFLEIGVPALQGASGLLLSAIVVQLVAESVRASSRGLTEGETVPAAGTLPA